MATYVSINSSGEVAAFPYNLAQLRRDSANVSFPKPISDELAATFGVYPVAQMERPTVTPAQRAVLNPAPELVDGGWVVGWTVVNKPAGELTDELQATCRELLDRINLKYQDEMMVVKNGYTPEEREGWPKQIAGAQVIVGGGTSPIVEGLAHTRNRTPLEMAERILGKNAAFEVVYTTFTANMHRLKALVEDNCEDADALATIDINTGWDLPPPPPPPA